MQVGFHTHISLLLELDGIVTQVQGCPWSIVELGGSGGCSIVF